MGFITLFNETDYMFAETRNSYGRKIKVAYTEDMTISELFEKIRNEDDEVEKRNATLEEEKKVQEEKNKQLEQEKKEILDIATDTEQAKISRLSKFFEYWEKNREYEEGKLVKHEDVVYRILNSHTSQSDPHVDKVNYKPIEE